MSETSSSSDESVIVTIPDLPLPPGLEKVQKVLFLKGKYNETWLRSLNLFYRLLDGEYHYSDQFYDTWNLTQTFKAQVEEAIKDMDLDDNLRMLSNAMNHEGTKQQEKAICKVDGGETGASALDDGSGEPHKEEGGEVSSPVCSAQPE
jgi:hypothetical protein